MLNRTGHRAGAAVLAVIALTAIGCGSTGSGSGSKPGDPIKIGAITSASGAIDFSSASAGAKAFFDDLNAHGGINGRKVQYLVKDDAGDPSKATAAVRELAGEGVVAFGGGGSVVECSANHKFYEQRDLFNIPGLGADGLCFSSPNIAAANTGPVVNGVLGSEVAIKLLHKRRVQYIAVDAPPGHASDGPVQGYLKGLGASAGPTEFVAGGQDATPNIVRVARRRPDAVVILAPQPIAIAIIKAAAAQGMGPAKVPTVAATPLYSPDTPAALGVAGDGVYAVSELTPIETQPAPATLDRWKRAMTTYAGDAHQDSPAEGGYLAAALLTEALRTVKGSLTPRAVTNAIKAIRGFDNGMTGGPLAIGDGSSHLPNHYNSVVRLQHGAWVHARQYGWLSFPPAGMAAR
jgi:branched-chain amino acid transport system substrate-binding protein